jgi:RNA polymerase sigma-32 factor
MLAPWLSSARTDSAMVAGGDESSDAPLLTREEEVDLAKRSVAGDRAAMARLIKAHRRFVIKIARKYRNYGLPMNDLVQEGTIGFIQAVKRFDPSRDVRLNTYAMWWIRASIQDHVIRSWSLVRVGTTAAQKALFFKLRRMMAELKGSADALGEEFLSPLAKRFGMPLKEARTVAMRASSLDQSLNRPIGRDDPEEWLAQVPDQQPTPEDNAVAASDRHFWNGLLARAFAALSPRERAIIRGRYLRERGQTREAIGRELGISKERVRQLEARALAKLRQFLAPQRQGANL